MQKSTVSQSCRQDCLDFAERMKRKAPTVRSENHIPSYVTEAEFRKQHSDAPLCNSRKGAGAERSSAPAHRVRPSGRTLVASACESSDRNDGLPLYSRLEGAPTRAFGGGGCKMLAVSEIRRQEASKVALRPRTSAGWRGLISPQ